MRNRNLNVLIKPASQSCNIDCKYCFYHDIALNREIEDYGKMKLDTIYTIIDKALEHVGTGSFTLGFQGGEPTLAGYDYYVNLINYVKEKNVAGAKVHYLIQTNGLLINEKWCKLFKENNFLVGLSIDGSKVTHDRNRVDYRGLPTFDKVMNAAKLFKEHHVAFNVLSVVTDDNLKEIKSTLKFFKENKFNYIQFIPSISSFDQLNKGADLTDAAYLKFLKIAFDDYYNRFMNKKYYSERFFDNVLLMYLGQEPESCVQKGNCSIQFIIEGDGSVYPCDFFVLDDFKMGNINTSSFEELYNTDVAKTFLQDSLKLHPKCQSCKYVRLCRGGCRRSKEGLNNDGLHKHCYAFYNFFEDSEQKFMKMRDVMIKKQAK